MQRLNKTTVLYKILKSEKKKQVKPVENIQDC